jgi:hypothetical protein
MRGLLNQWSNQDPHAAADFAAAAGWLQELPVGPTRDQAAQTLVSLLASQQPDLAAPWISAFSDEAERNKQIERIARKWLATDPNACGKWLQTTALPEERKQQLLSPCLANPHK